MADGVTPTTPPPSLSWSIFTEIFEKKNFWGPKVAVLRDVRPKYQRASLKRKTHFKMILCFFLIIYTSYALPSSRLSIEPLAGPGITCRECNRDPACSTPSVSLRPKCPLYCHTAAGPAGYLDKSDGLLHSCVSE